MNILITGSGGFIGKYLANSLSKSHEVIGLTSVAGKLNAPIKEFYFDLSNHNSVAAFIKQLKASKKQPFIDLLLKKKSIYDHFYDSASEALHMVSFENFAK